MWALSARAVLSAWGTLCDNQPPAVIQGGWYTMNDQANADSAGSVDSGSGQIAGHANGDAPSGSASAGTDRVPVSLATQKLRLAVTMSGGVSLAVWMGGVAREINLLTQASDLRERGPVRSLFRPRPGRPRAASPSASATCTGNCST